MKRYIRYIAASKGDLADPSLFAGTPFTYKKASGYEDYLDSEKVAYYRDQKNRVGKIIMMTPDEYIQECAEGAFKGRVTPEELKQSRYASKDKDGNSLIDSYVKAMKSGDKFPMCYIDYTGHQEGIHRMIAAGIAFGWNKKFPVLVVTTYDQDKENRWNDMDDYRRFIKYGTFREVCQAALDNYIDYDQGMEIPSDFVESFRDAVISTAATYEDGYDIDVSIELVENNNKHEANVYVTRFGVYEIPRDYLDDPYVIGLDYIYDYGEDSPAKDTSDWVDTISDEDIDEAIANGVDLNDYDAIMNYFFRNN